ncbi:hypothetical protein Bbelb_063420 [Branchiostoma belcheri]|nr:hypothetical protein Bbelb_063420 [Branchiostoma belcheri]
MASSADDSVRKVVRHEAHSTEMLGGFHKMRQSKTLCDVTLWAEEKPFAVHKTVLASTSEYFSVMFTCGMREIDQDDIYLHGITLAGLSTVLDFVYTSELPVSMETIQDVVCAASHLQISSALALCETFLRDEISLDNCLYVMNLCNTFGLKQLAKEATDFVAKMFQDLVQKKSDQVLDLTWEEFLPILQNNKLNASELQIFQTVVQWVEYEREVRVYEAKFLLEAVRFPLMTWEELHNEVLTTPFVLRDKEAHNRVATGFSYHSTPLMHHLCQSPDSQVRADTESLVIMGGWMDEGRTAEVLFLNDTLEVPDWARLANMPVARAWHTVVMMDNFVYVLGGFAKGVLCASGLRYDPRFNSWMKIADMWEKRYEFPGVTWEGKILALGGSGLGKDSAEVETYTPDEDRWNAGTPLPRATHGHAAVVFHNKIYISGGRSSETPNLAALTDLYTYDPDSNNVVHKRHMKHRRKGHAMCAIQGRLYVLGGGEIAPAECYDPYQDLWWTIPGLEGLGRVSAAVVKDFIYFLPEESVQVEYFDIDTGERTRTKPMPIKRFGAVCPVFLSEHFKLKTQHYYVFL